MTYDLNVLPLQGQVHQWHRRQRDLQSHRILTVCHSSDECIPVVLSLDAELESTRVRG